MAHADKVMIIGLCGAEPSLALERWADDLPNIRRLAAGGLSGTLRSAVPIARIPGWSCLAASKDPGTLGFYGERARRDYTYENLGTLTNLEMRQPRLWDHVARAGRQSIVLGVPQTFPMLRPPKGCMVTCHLTPGPDAPYTHPPELAEEIARLVGEYQFDLSAQAGERREWLLDSAQRLDEQRFRLAQRLLKTQPWDLFWLVAPGLDHVQRGLWEYMDPEHPRHRPDDPLAGAVRGYYTWLDGQIGMLLEELDLEQTAVWVVSEHGARRLDGGFCINDWLQAAGLLALKTPPAGVRPLDLADVDWGQTQVWGTGGCCAALYINRAEREPRGIVANAAYAALRSDLIRRLEGLVGPEGKPLGLKVFKPERLYANVYGVPPDLLVVPGEARWTCIEAVGHSSVFARGADECPDGAGASMHGLYVLAHPTLPNERHEASTYDVVPTTLELMGLPVPRGLRGASIL